MVLPKRFPVNASATAASATPTCEALSLGPISPSPDGLGSGERSRPQPEAGAPAAKGPQPEAAPDAGPRGNPVGAPATLAALVKQDVSDRWIRVRGCAATAVRCGAALATACTWSPDAEAQPTPASGPSSA
eukprot:9478750-Pyramimonas_sp.AAC.1